MILSSAGKPIYTRYGDESKLATVTGVIQAFLSVSLLQGDLLTYIQAGDHLYVFFISGPLYYIAISSTGESVNTLRSQLELLHSTIVFTLTETQISNIFKVHSNFDLRDLMIGTDILLDSVSKSFGSSPFCFLKSTALLKLPSKLRKSASKALSTSNLPKSCIFGLLISNKKLVSLYQADKGVGLGERDIFLLINLFYSAKSFRFAESWIPVCLPQYNTSAFLHCYASFITDELCLILLSVDKDAFFDMSSSKERVIENLKKHMTSIDENIKMDPLSIVELGIPSLRHCIVRFKKHFYEWVPIAPYTVNQEKKRLYRLYESLESSSGKINAGHPPLTHVTDFETVLLQKFAGFDLYMAFSPLIMQADVKHASDKASNWLLLNQESLFLS